MFENPVFHFIIFIFVGCLFLAFMDLVQDINPPDSGFWSRKTGPSKNDAWHWSKRAAIGAFAWSPVSFMPEFWAYFLVYTAIIATVTQVIFYNVTKIIIFHIRARNI